MVMPVTSTFFRIQYIHILQHSPVWIRFFWHLRIVIVKLVWPLCQNWQHLAITDLCGELRQVLCFCCTPRSSFNIERLKVTLKSFKRPFLTKSNICCTQCTLRRRTKRQHRSTRTSRVSCPLCLHSKHRVMAYSTHHCWNSVKFLYVYSFHKSKMPSKHSILTKLTEVQHSFHALF